MVLLVGCQEQCSTFSSSRTSLALVERRAAREERCSERVTSTTPEASSTDTAGCADSGVPGSAGAAGRVMSRSPRPSSPLYTFSWLL